MEKMKDKERSRRIIKFRILKKVSGNSTRPRLAVFKSLRHIYAQAVDDVAGKTLACASTLDKNFRSTLKSGGNIEGAKVIGEAIAQKLKEKGIESVVFDRGGYLYHGRVKALAEAARAAGLKF